MPLISNVGRKNFRVRSALGLIYLILTVGALTMIYPFALMISNSLTSYADYEEYRLVPRYLYNGKVLFKKYIVDKLKINFLAWEYGENWYHPRNIKVDSKILDMERSIINQEKSELIGKNVYRKKVYKYENDLDEYYDKPQAELNRIVDDYRSFFETVPVLYRFAYFRHAGSMQWTILNLGKDYRRWLETRFGTIDKLNEAYLDNAEKFEQVGMPYADPLRQRWVLPLDEKWIDWENFKRELPIEKVWVISGEFAFQKFLREEYPLVDDLNLATGLALENNHQLTMSRAFAEKLLPEDVRERFIRFKCPIIFLRLDKSLTPDFKAFIREKYRGFSEDIQKQKAAAEFTEACPMSSEYSGLANDWIEFMEQKAPLDKISFYDPTIEYQKFLERKFGNLEEMNQSYGWNFERFSDIRLPAPWIDIYTFRERKAELFWKYFTGNYIEVFKVIAVHGRALMNTIIYIGLTILGTLTINPLAAYALSRFKLSYTNKILLFMLATMAFPPSVGMIPSFLLLKDLNLLNTFAALVLPGLANGYGIFLLKGFFDSLPAEIYEAALIDGASEMTIFYKLSLPLTKPILAIMSLNAFRTAYSAFMFAFLVCQSPRMWTLMVFLYEFQQTHPNYLVMASLVVAAIPTLVVFIFCQNIILRGIVIPSFK